MTTPPPNTSHTALLCQRLRLISFALMSAQFFFIVTGWLATHGATKGFHPDAPAKNLIVAAGLAAGLIAIAVSFLLPRPQATGVQQLASQFFTGFAVSEVAALIGVGLCFFFGSVAVLVILAIATAASIYAHGMRAINRIQEAPDQFSPQ
jgi:hypothetical protein